jgi:hypothetical protein
VLGLERDYADFGSGYVFEGSEPEVFIEALPGLAKNQSLPRLGDRSAELVGRQSCDVGYGYCSGEPPYNRFSDSAPSLTLILAFNRCCPSSNTCCSYGYCLEPGKICCPNGSCDEGNTCCGNGCMPTGSQCCRDGRYCEAGNMCVLYDGRGVCCTDLSCTAVVDGGSTSYVRTTTQAPDPPAPTITQPPPQTTEFTIVDSYTTYYWTVRWRYFSYYWTVFQARSTVTYTTITYTTIYTTTATDIAQASSIFDDLSRTLTFSTPAEATSLASLIDAAPSPTATPTTAFETDFGTLDVPGPTSRDELTSEDETTTGRAATRSSTTRTSSRSTSSSSSQGVAVGGGGASAAGAVMVQMSFLALSVCIWILMVWL